MRCGHALQMAPCPFTLSRHVGTPPRIWLWPLAMICACRAMHCGMLNTSHPHESSAQNLWVCMVHFRTCLHRLGNHLLWQLTTEKTPHTCLYQPHGDYRSPPLARHVKPCLSPSAVNTTVRTLTQRTVCMSLISLYKAHQYQDVGIQKVPSSLSIACF
jgi:hypothetical protein